MTDPRPFDRRAIIAVAYATGTALALGLAFVFVRSPLPWGWEGFDFYHERALTLARDGVFNTTDVPWGYVALLAAHYRLFGDKPWIPLTVQVVLNAAMPAMTYRLARLSLDERTSAVAAVLVGIGSFNTMYAATQSSDAVCNVLFLAGILLFALGLRSTTARSAAGAGLLLGIAPQFRPNLLLFPFVLATMTPFRAWRRRATIKYVAIVLVVVVAADVPWTVRNYRLTGLFLPTSTHGAVQLFYGSLELGPYLNARTRNPRHVFETSPLPYSTVSDKPIIVTARVGNCHLDKPPQVEFWTDRQTEARRAEPSREGDRLQYELPGQPTPTTVYYRFVSATSGSLVEVSAAGDPVFIYFISDDHLGDLDRHGDLLDVFDVARLMLHVLWGVPVPLPFADRLDADHDGLLTRTDLDSAVKALLWELPAWSGHWLPPTDDVVRTLSPDGDVGVLRFRDGSEIRAPRGFTKVTDLIVSKGLALQLAFTTRPLVTLATGIPPSVPPCRAVLDLGVNEVFYRHDVDQMRRHSALAMENIRRQPVAFAAAALYRAARVFVVIGSSDELEARKFSGSAIIYRAGLVVSLAAFVLFAVGVFILARRRQLSWILLLPPAYASATIAPFFTNMRYTITVQPFIFILIAVTLVAAFDRIRGSRFGRP